MKYFLASGILFPFSEIKLLSKITYIIEYMHLMNLAHSLESNLSKILVLFVFHNWAALPGRLFFIGALITPN